MPEADPAMLYRALKAHCASAPSAVERYRLGETLYEVGGRVFAFLNSPKRPAVTVRVDSGNRPRLLLHPAVERSRWLGWIGWVTVSVSDDESLRLARDLIDRSYEQVARRRT